MLRRSDGTLHDRLTNMHNPLTYLMASFLTT